MEIPLNRAVCPKCGSKNTGRCKSVPQVGGAVWKCLEPACGESFFVRALVLFKKVVDSPGPM